MKKSFYNGLAIVKLFRLNKWYGIGVSLFFMSYVALSFLLDASLSPLFRNWNMFKGEEYVAPLYYNSTLVVNDSIDIGDIHLFDATRGLISGQLYAYVTIRETGSDGLYVLVSGTLRRFFPQYEERQHNPVSDTTMFKKIFLKNLSGYLGLTVKKVQLLNYSVYYDKNGFAHIKKYTPYLEFKQ